MPVSRTAFAALSALLLAFPAASHAATVISNQAQATAGADDLDAQDGPQAQSFITGGIDLYINSITLELGAVNGTTTAPLTVSLYADDSGSPGTDLVQFIATVPSPTAAGSYVYTAPTGSFQVSPDSEYWIVAYSDSDINTGNYSWNFTDSTSVDNPDATFSNVDATSGWSLDLTNTAASFDSDSDGFDIGSGQPFQFYVSASPVPEPGTWALLATGAAFLFGLAKSRRSRTA